MHISHLSLAKKYWKNHVSPEDLAIDATCGAGQDTLFLSQILPKGKVYAFDIQLEAIERTEALLKENQVEDRVILCHQSHASWKEGFFPSSPNLIVYNLGYLPKGNKAITTQVETTLESIQKGLSLLKSSGAMSITCYPGHDEGAKEEEAISRFLASLCPKKWMVCHHRFVNRLKSPSLFWCEKIP